MLVGKLYTGILIHQEYEKLTVQLSIPGYVCVSLHSFQHEKQKIPQDSPYPCTQPIYGKNKQMLPEKELAEELDENDKK